MECQLPLWHCSVPFPLAEVWQGRGRAQGPCWEPTLQTWQQSARPWGSLSLQPRRGSHAAISKSLCSRASSERLLYTTAPHWIQLSAASACSRALLRLRHLFPRTAHPHVGRATPALETNATTLLKNLQKCKCEFKFLSEPVLKWEDYYQHWKHRYQSLFYGKNISKNNCLQVTLFQLKYNYCIVKITKKNITESEVIQFSWQVYTKNLARILVFVYHQWSGNIWV